jgi:tetratricopeptide (TPR) repeat protein
MGRVSDKQIVAIRAKAISGDIDAQYELSAALRSRGSKDEVIESLYWWEETAKSCPDANVLLRIACSYQEIDNHKKAFEYFNKTIEINRSSTINEDGRIALFELGRMFRFGTHVGKDIHKALEFYHRAAKRDPTETFNRYASIALDSIAEIYEDGEGVHADSVKAFEYYRQAAEIGSNVGVDFMIQSAKEGNLNAMRCVEKASEAGWVVATEYLKKRNKKPSILSTLFSFLSNDEPVVNSARRPPSKTAPKTASASRSKTVQHTASKAIAQAVSKPKVIPVAKNLPHNGYKASYPGHTKCCGTCDYWGGEREADMYTKLTYTPQTSTKGQCRNGASPYRKQLMTPFSGGTCKWYLKWGQIS